LVQAQREQTPKRLVLTQQRLERQRQQELVPRQQGQQRSLLQQAQTPQPQALAP
jgi:hypothetical protein